MPTEEDFVLLRDLLVSRYQFTETTFPEIRSRSPHLQDVIAPRRRPGRETGFHFSANDYHVFVWTTWLAREGCAREVDTGWVLIADSKGETRYFAQPVHRTKNFIRNLANEAWIARCRITNRPKCPKCDVFMKIVPGPNLKSRYWQCDRVEQHRDGEYASVGWDAVLPQTAVKARHFLKLKRKQRRLHRKSMRKQGKPCFQAMLRRKKWRQRPPAPRR